MDAFKLLKNVEASMQIEKELGSTAPGESKKFVERQENSKGGIERVVGRRCQTCKIELLCNYSVT